MYEKIFENIANHYRNSFLIFAALICIGLFVDYDDHIENGRYTYVPEEENKGNEYIEFKLTDNGKDDSKLTYYNSIEEAILNSPLKAEHENLSAPEDFLNHVDEIVAAFCDHGDEPLVPGALTGDIVHQGHVSLRGQRLGLIASRGLLPSIVGLTVPAAGESNSGGCRHAEKRQEHGGETAKNSVTLHLPHPRFPPSPSARPAGRSCRWHRRAGRR